DGIRDDLVTGVQTCALPICRPLAPPDFQFIRDCVPEPSWIVDADTMKRLVVRERMLRQECVQERTVRQSWRALGGHSRLPVATRSEERRVGKECISRMCVYE